jgi:drug/metabolite transporter (DMT)-like permease
VTPPRLTAFALLATANLFWAGTWVTGRALRDAFEPATLNFWRWVIAVLVLAPFALPALRGQGATLRRHAGILLFLAFSGVALFQSLVYLGLRSTTAVNALLINSSLPLFMLLCSWLIERERASPRQIAGMLVSLAGILVILSRGSPAALLELELHAGDGWILLAMPVWGVYSVLLKRRPPEIGGLAFLFVLSVAGTVMLLPFAVLQPGQWPTPAAAGGVVYMGVFASVLAFIFCANAAGFTIHLLPAFGTVLAILFLGETFAGYHAAGIATILAGVILATRK